ncbi:MAG: hypothetical protein P4L45_14970, partial [Ignavibacteriaceae bacterium]|nr:hypothetical protein [Ignavibacteriaceae bacterium]
MNRILNYLIKNIFKIVIAYFVFQFLLVIFWQQPFQSDSHYYYKLAQDCLKYHSIYPAKAHLYEDYIIAPLYVNLLVAALSIYNAQITIGFLNILLNALQMFLLFRLSERFTDRKTACVCLLLYMCYLNILGLVLINLTEMFFEVLVLSSLYFFYKDSNKSLFLAGVFAAASIAVRPVGWGLVAAFLITLAVRFIKRNYVTKQLIALILGLSLFIIALGTVTQISFGKFIYTSSTGPLNLLIGANDNTTGAFNARVLEKGNVGYIQNSDSLTYIEKENFYKQKTKDWIISHPAKWLSLIPAKIFFMFAWDDFT